MRHLRFSLGIATLEVRPASAGKEELREMLLEAHWQLLRRDEELEVFGTRSPVRLRVGGWKLGTAARTSCPASTSATGNSSAA